MRTLLIALCALTANAAIANPVMCGDKKPQRADLLSPEQWRAVLDGRAGGDPVLEEAAALERVSESDANQDGVRLVRPGDQPQILTWGQARTIILLGAARLLVQSHNLTVQILARSGKSYKTHEPRIDDVWKIAAIVDPCGIYIRRVTQ